MGRRLEVHGLGQVRAGQAQAHVAEVDPEPGRAEGGRLGVEEADGHGGGDGRGRDYGDRGAGQEEPVPGAARADRRPAVGDVAGQAVAQAAAVVVQRQQRHGQRPAAGRSADDREQPQRADDGRVAAEEAGAGARGQAPVADAQERRRGRNVDVDGRRRWPQTAATATADRRRWRRWRRREKRQVVRHQGGLQGRGNALQTVGLAEGVPAQVVGRHELGRDGRRGQPAGRTARGKAGQTQAASGRGQIVCGRQTVVVAQTATEATRLLYGRRLQAQTTATTSDNGKRLKTKKIWR